MNMLLSIRDAARKSARLYLPSSLFALGARRYNRMVCRRKIRGSEYNHFIDQLEGRATSGLLQVKIDGLKHPIWIRAGTPDAEEVVHASVREAYGKYLPAGEVRFIIDAGAYIGDTATWYLSRFPSCRVVALEPNSETFSALERNCAPYYDRIRLMPAGLWYRDEQLRVVPNPATPTGISVVPCPSEAPGSCRAVSPATILKEERAESIDIFKIDIEGAEEQLFSMDPDPWLARTRSIFIEIHSPAAFEAVIAATRRHGYSRFNYRELFIFKRPRD
jgi:FkbM family methyltransferase